MELSDNPIRVLYITFIDFDAPSGSGSAVRPKRMYDAFLSLGCEVKLLSGITNNRTIRSKGVREIKKWLKNNIPDICYIEPPTGPLFFSCDRNLIRKLHKMDVPIGFFYRDIYWKFSGKDFSSYAKGMIGKIKELLIKLMQRRDYILLKKCVTQFYFPTLLASQYMKIDNFSVLPPGCLNLTVKRNQHEIITGIYVGGATERYGMGLILDSWKEVLKVYQARLIIVCPEQQWKTWLTDHLQYQDLPEMIEIYHLSDGEELEKLYSSADFSLIPILKTAYNDMAMPIKLYEYISRDLPIVATDCIAMQEVIRENKIGVVSHDNCDSYSKAIKTMIQQIKEGNDYYKEHLQKACEENLWIKRAEAVIQDLMK